MKIRLITMVHPCSACIMIEGLLREVFEKVSRMEEFAGDTFEIVVLNHPRELSSVEGLEVPELPAVIVGEMQVSAGRLLHRRQLVELIREEKAYEQ